MTNETRFRPVTGEEAKILSSEHKPGWVYFASDTGRIYFDYDENTRLMMGGGNGATIFYAADANVIDVGADNEYRIHYSALEEEASDPKEKDIIINTEDNCFYKVISVEDNFISVVRIAVAGSGGNTGEGPSTPTGECSATIVGSNKISTLYGEPCFLEFEVVAKNAAGINTEGGYVAFYAGEKKNINQSSIPLVDNIVVTNGVGKFDIGPYLQNITQEQSITAKFMLDDGSEDYIGRTVVWKITAYDVKQFWEYDSSRVNSDNMFYINYEAIGVNGLEKVVTHAIIDNNLDISKDKVNVGKNEIVINRSQYNLSHGVHTIELYTEFWVGSKAFRTNSIVKEIMFADADNKTPIIITGDFNRVVDQYDTRVIPIYIYNATSAQLMADGELIDTLDDIDEIPSQGSLKYWFYTPTESGLHKLSIACGSVKYDIDIVVNELQLTVEETAGYAFKIKASEFTSPDSLKKWSYKTPENETVTLSFSDNFDWENGGLKDEDDESGNKRPFICIKAGTRMTINYKLFEKANRNGKNIKVVFKVANCGKYDAEIINSYDTFSNRGLLMTAQSALFKSSGSSITSQYCEENYTEYEIDYTPFATVGSDNLQYVMPWLAGVPAGITLIPENDTFNQPSNHLTNIVIGSDDCDVNLYLFKVYEKHLSDRQHLDNFIMDALNAKEILSRHDRNNVLSDSGNGEIDWRKVLEKNPNCWIHLYKIPRITKNKKDEIGKTYLSEIGEGKESTAETPKYYALYKDGDVSQPVIQAGTDVGCPFSYKVQGTSSEKYVISAANLDSNFKKGFIDKEGNKVKTFSLDETVPGESYFNTKVNVASCEGANNALNAAWYNDHQPYVSAAKARNPKKRDTMLFKPGIVFIQDENPLYEITDPNSQSNLDLNIFKGDSTYRNNTFYKQYAVCNFGNSKKNKATLHDENNPSEITIEVTDNQNIGQHMCQVTGRKSHTEKDKDGKDVEIVESFDITGQEISYEIVTEQVDGKEVQKVVGNETYNQFYLSMDDNDFDVRYTSGTDGIDNATPQQIVGWFNLCNWFASNDPNEKSESHPHGWDGSAFTADTPNAKKNNVTGKYEVTFEPYVFKNSISFETGDGYSHTYPSKLAGLRIGTYAGTYTNDTHEYRMAKMLSECEDHIIMDSVIYHYLFIERHLMVDNVAKNTFWSSEDKDNQYWQLIKDYDNDTADGIDNDGKLSFTYGIEPEDRQPSGLSYFNAPNTVWFNFVHGLESVRKDMYQKLKEAWSVNSYLNVFENWQSAIPEICWIEDYYRKYIRPYEIFKDSSYLARLEGGKKTYQRKQFEIYQSQYMDSKYESLGGNGTFIYLRANSDTPRDIELPVTMYSDCYVYQSWSQNIVKSRVKRGETYIVKCPENISRLDDATVYWYFANTYSTIGDLGALKTKRITLGESKRLQTLIATGGENGEKLPPFDGPSDLAMEQAVLLKHIKLNGLSSSTGVFPVNLKDLASLQDFDGTNSDFTSISFPNGAPITSIKAESPKTLSASNLRYLTEFTLNDYKNLESVFFDNIDSTGEFNLLDFVTKADALAEYCLLNVHWKLSSTADKVYFNDSDSSISFLDKLANLEGKDFSGRESVASAKALTGTLTISKEAYDGTHSLDYYEKYSKIFPNLEIVFESENCKLLDVTVLDGNNKVAWNRKFRQSISLTRDFFNGGTPQSFLEVVNDVINSKSSNTQEIFTFANKWLVNGAEVIVSPQYDEDGNLIPSSALPLNKTVSGEEVIITPVFDAKTRQYKISYYSLDGSELYYEEMADYGSYMSEISKKFYPYKDDSALPEKETYQLKGWAIQKNGEKLSTDSYNKLTVQSDYSFYGVFEPISVYQNILDESYLTRVGRYNYPSLSIANELYNAGNILDPDFKTPITKCSEISFASNIKLKGKITLPISYQGEPIYAFAENTNKVDLSEVTHIFWEPSSETKPLKMYAFLTGAFRRMTSLKFFEIPESLRFIGSQAFYGDTSLEMPRLSDGNILYIANSAFYSIKGSNKIIIPSTILHGVGKPTIGPLVFYRWNTTPVSLQFGEAGDPTNINFGDLADQSFCFDQSGAMKFADLYVYSTTSDLNQIVDGSDYINNRKREVFSYHGQDNQTSLPTSVEHYHLNLE